MTELRYLVKIIEDRTWDERWDEWRTTTTRLKPVLQYRDMFGWHDVPTVEIKQ